MKITIPEPSLVVLVGVSGSGKSTFARRHFKPTEILSSDYFRAAISDDENDQTVTLEAFEILHFILTKRLELKRLTVIDATNVESEHRATLIKFAERFNVIPIAIVFNFAEKVLLERRLNRTDRHFDVQVLYSQLDRFYEDFESLKDERFKEIFEFRTPEEVDAVTIERTPVDRITEISGNSDELR